MEFCSNNEIEIKHVCSSMNGSHIALASTFNIFALARSSTTAYCRRYIRFASAGPSFSIVSERHACN